MSSQVKNLKAISKTDKNEMFHDNHLIALQVHPAVKHHNIRRLRRRKRKNTHIQELKQTAVFLAQASIY